MKKTVCIIDDEFRARERVRNLLKNEAGFSIIGEADNGSDAVELIDRVEPDLVILDIKMPGLSGFQILQKTIHKPAVIFVTAFNQHAVQAFEVHAIDYLLKPFQDERFREALSQIHISETPNTDTLIELRELIEGSITRKTYFDRITVKDRFEFLVIPVIDIDFFSTEDGLVFLHTKGIRYVIDQTLMQLEENLDPDLFYRAHRKSLVNIKKVERMIPWGRGRYVLRFSGDDTVHLSKEKTRKFKSLIGLN
ncbi:MAG: LytTR family DNA-binding domain-containing protein [Spirochaetia bacterium]|jgi:two-component system LytT family response regulator|nr:LytTR family DNA-binding domain-containing protein [Spirochaetia bacterium]